MAKPILRYYYKTSAPVPPVCTSPIDHNLTLWLQTLTLSAIFHQLIKRTRFHYHYIITNYTLPYSYHPTTKQTNQYSVILVTSVLQLDI